MGLCLAGLCCAGLRCAPSCCADTGAVHPAAVTDMTIEFVSPSYTAGPQIVLGDIARVHVVDDALRSRLERVEVGPAPLPGASRKINIGQVQVRMRQHKLDPTVFSFQGPAEVSVIAVAERVAASGIEQAAVLAVCADASNALDAQAVRVIRFDYPQGLTVPPGPVALEASVVPPGADAALVRADVRIVVGGSTVRTVPVWMEITAPPAVLRGDAVLLVAAGPGVCVTAPAAALEDGRLGQRIRVKNTISGAIVTGRVMDPNTVHVTLTAMGGVP